MRKVFNTIGIVGLIVISFVYTEKTMTVVREYDSIMVKIKEQKNIKGIDAIINDDTIIPGILERQINRKESYKAMKQYGYYNETLLIYDKIDNKISLKNNYDKYIISGNKTKNMVSLIFSLNWNSDIKKIKQIIDKYNIKVSFLVDDKWFDNNNELIQKLIKEEHTIISKYESNFKWTNTIIRDVLNQKHQYCITDKRNSEILDNCSKEKAHIILTKTLNNNLVIELKKVLESGSIINFELNTNLEEQLDNMIKYIKSKGFIITNLIEHLEE